MTNFKAILPILAAALVIGVAAPAMAKKQASGEAATAQTQQQAKRQAQKTCRRNPPPFMYNPRFMNRGFFKKKCPADKR